MKAILKSQKTINLLERKQLIEEYLNLSKFILNNFKEILLEPNRFKNKYRSNEYGLQKSLLVDESETEITLFLEKDDLRLSTVFKVNTKKNKITEMISNVYREYDRRNSK